MITITLWLLVSVGEYGGNTAQPTVVVERFADQRECSWVLDRIREAGNTHRGPRLRCIQATVVKGGTP